MRVDSHAHVWPPGALSAGEPSIAAAGSVESLVSAMLGAGVDAAVLVQPFASGLDHSYLLQSVRSERLNAVGIAQVDPHDASSIEVIADVVRDADIVGFRLPLIRTDATWLGRNGESFWALAAAQDVSVSLLASPGHFEQVALMAAAYPSVPVVIDHLGRFDLSDDPVSSVDRLCDLAALPNVYAKASALSSLGRGIWPYRDVWPYLTKVIDAFGTDRMMWGSDYPFVLAQRPYADSPLAVEKALEQRQEPEAEAILGRNAFRLFFRGREVVA